MQSLPAELVVHIAVCSDATTTLRLAQTCRSIRAVCNDYLVFRTILENSQILLWRESSLISQQSKEPCLNIEAISTRCNEDVPAWARYAVADQRAWELSQRPHPLEDRLESQAWMAELFVVRHPFAYHVCWRHHHRPPTHSSLREIFCLAIAALASKEPLEALESSLESNFTALDELMVLDELKPSENADVKTFLWTFVVAITEVKSLLGSRDFARINQHIPSSSDYINPPCLDQINMVASTPTSLNIPIPFSGDDWYRWYTQFGPESFRHRNGIEQGSWQGYYTMPNPNPMLEPPMRDINLSLQLPLDQSLVRARDCRDGVGLFDLVGRWGSNEDEVSTFRGHKLYRRENHGNSWSWDYHLKLTPFGFVGHWSDRSSPLGVVWLWKS